MSPTQRIYVASSWRNAHQPKVVNMLRELGHEVYDFRNPKEGDNGFRWSELDPDGWENWSPQRYREILRHPVSVAAFEQDFQAMEWADTCLLVLPAGRSASWELGWSVGAGKRVAVYMPDKMEPELMYGGAGKTDILISEAELTDFFRRPKTCPYKGCSDPYGKRPPCALCYE